MQELTISCLGSLRISLGGEALTAFHSSKVPALLSYLAVTGRTYPRTALAGLLWRDLPETNARANLRKALSNLRRVAGPYLDITRYEAGLNKEAKIWLDVAVLEQGVVPGASKEQLHQALSLYKGDFLYGFEVSDAPAFEQWSLLQRIRLRDTAVQGLTAMIALLERESDFSSAIQYARQLLEIEPWREEAHRRLIKLLAQTGQRSAALKQYETCQQILRNEFGVEPSAETKALYSVIRRDEGNARAATQFVTEELVASRKGAEYRSNLPAEATPFIGRVPEKQTIIDSINEPACWLLTMTGPGGIGKTRLALNIAARLLPDFGGEVYWTPLFPLRDGTLMLQTIARALGVRDVAQDLLQDQVVLALNARRKVLLLLDNFEHLLVAAPLLSELHTACPGTKFLVTSREPLRLYGEKIFPVPSLQIPPISEEPDKAKPGLENESMALFVQQATAADPSFELIDENADIIAAICRWLQGHPLAIELAAARIGVLSPRAILDRFAQQDALEWLRQPTRDRPDRQQSLRATLDWSYQLLDTAEQTLFEQLAIFAGGFTMAAVSVVCSGDLDPLDGISSLVDKGLLVKQGEVAGIPRFDMLRPVHEYAWELLEQSGALISTAENHLSYYVELAEHAAPELKGPGKLAWLDQLEAEQDNIRLALGWAVKNRHAELALRLTSALLWYWYVRGPTQEGYRWLTRALDLAEGIAGSNHLRALVAAGILADRLGNQEAARSLLEEGVIMSREYDDRFNLAYALSTLSTVEWNRERRDNLECESEALFRRIGDKWGLAHLYYRQGHDYLWQMRDIMAARNRLEASVSLFKEVGDRWQLHEPLTMLGDSAAATGDYKEANALYYRALDLCQETGDEAGVGWALTSLARSAMAQMAYGKAAEFWEQSARCYERCGWLRGICFTCLDRGTLARLQGDYDRAQQLLEKSSELAHDIGLESSLSYIAQELGYALIYGRRFVASIYHLKEALRSQVAEQQPLHAALAVPGVAAVAASLDQPERAALLVDAAKLLERTIIHKLGFAFNQLDYARHLTLAETTLAKVERPAVQMEWPTAKDALIFAADEVAELCRLVDQSPN